MLEALLLVVPAAVAAPWIAAWALGAVDRFGLTPVGLEMDPIVTRGSYTIVIVAALAAVMVLAWPAYRSARAFRTSGSRHRRQRARSGQQRTGIDIALLALAGLAFWQLWALGPQKAARVQGRFSVDPMLVIAPALGLLAGAVLALRVIPLMARTAEFLVSRGRGAVSALAGWQVSRRPARYSRPSLLLVMAISLGIFAASYSSTWTQSQEDQAAHRVGAELRLSPNRRTNDSITDLHLVSAHESIDGVTRSMAVIRRAGPLAGTDLTAQFVVLDAARAADVVRIRGDLSPDFVELMDAMVAGRPQFGQVPLPGQPSQVELLVDVVEPELTDDEDEVLPVEFGARVSLVVQDGNGMLHRIELGDVVANEGPTVLTADLTAPLGSGITASPSYPLSIVDVEVRSLITSPRALPVTLELSELTVVDGSGSTQPVDVDFDIGAWLVEASTASGLIAHPSIAESGVQPEHGLRLAINPGSGFEPVPIYFSIRPTGTVLPDSFPVVVSESWLESSRRARGDSVRLPSLRMLRDEAHLLGAVETFPTVDPGFGEVVLVDLATFQMMDYELGRGIDQVTEHWLDVSTDDLDTLGATLLGNPYQTVEIAGRQDTAASLRTDPTALGTIGALAVGFVAAAVFAAVGFVVSATVSARDRMTEFGLLRALGLSRRQLGTWMSIEQGVLIVVSLVLGTLVGLALTASILPLISVTQEGAAVIPSVRVIYPWKAVIALELALIAVLGVIVVVMSIVLRRLGLGSLLRMGED